MGADEIEEIKRRKMEELMRKINEKKANITVSSADFEKEVIERSYKVPVVADFWAPWCAPCRMLGPVLERIASDYNGKIVLAKINVDENQDIAKAFSVMSIPSVKMFKRGRVVDGFIGALPENAVRSWIEKHLQEEV